MKISNITRDVLPLNHRMKDLLLNIFLIISLLITIIFSIIDNQENQHLLLILGIFISLLMILRQFVIKAELTTKLGKVLFFIELTFVFIIQFYDSSFVTQIYFFILISDAALHSSFKFSLFSVIFAYSLYVLGRFIYFDFPDFSVINFVIPRSLEYILVFGFSSLAKYFIQQKQIISETVNELQRKKDELEVANEKLKKANQEIEKNTLLKERTRIAREIHDTVGHALTNALISIEVGEKLFKSEPDQAKGKLLHAKQQIQNGVKDIRKSVKLLKENPNQKEAFLPTIYNLIKEIELHSEITIHRYIDFPYTIHLAQEHVLLRALQEGITNGLKHGKSKTFYFTLKKRKDYIEFVLKDDGVGCDSVKFGFGLTAMKERVEELNGNMKFFSKKGEGSKLELEIPMNHYSDDMERD